MPADETNHRLLQRTFEQLVSEQLAGQLLMDQGYTEFDPIHPFGGPDGGRDGHCRFNGESYVMAVYFPRGEKSFSEIKMKFAADAAKAATHGAVGIAFVTNQELKMSERTELETLAGKLKLDLFHNYRVAAILNQPRMAQVRREYLGIEAGPVPLDISLHIGGQAISFADSHELRDLMLDADDQRRREDAGSRRDQNQLGRPALQTLNTDLFAPREPEPPTEQELERWLTERRERMGREWASSEEYLAAHTAAPLSFVVTNTAASFLHDVELVITIEGARGIDAEAPTDFNFDRFLDSEYTPPAWPFGIPSLSALKLVRPAGNPVGWRNRDNGLQITVNLPVLRPQRPWESDDDDLVVVAAVGAGESVRVSWVATARDYGTPFIGEESTLPVAKVQASDAVEELFRAFSEE